MKFKEIIGQEHIVAILKRMVDQNNLAHAIMLSGKSGYGSLALAMAMAQYVNCTDRKDGDSCGECNSCRLFEKNEHPDMYCIYPVNKSSYAKQTTADGSIVSDSFIERWRVISSEITPRYYFSENQWYQTMGILDGKSKNIQGNIGKSEANELIKKLGYKSYKGGYKVVIFWLPERMNVQASNSLLKLFEEPAQKTLFLFACEDSAELLPTINSRLQTVNIPPIDVADIKKWLMAEHSKDDQEASVIARISMGSIIKANDLLEAKDEQENSNLEIFMSLMRYCFKVDFIGLIDWADKLSALGRESQKDFFTYCTNMLREAFMKNMNIDNITYSHAQELGFLEKFHPFIHSGNIEQLIEAFRKVEFDISHNANAKIAITHFTLAISKLIKK